MADNFRADGPHWQFSIATYRKPGVQSACLFLQETHGVDVNVLLLALYGSSRLNICFTETEIVLLDEHVQQFRKNVVAPLRAVRRWLKGASLGSHGEAVRNRVKITELQAERLEQAIIATWMSGIKQETASSTHLDTATRIVNHFARLNGTRDNAVRDRATHEAIKTIVTAAMSTDGRS